MPSEDVTTLRFEDFQQTTECPAHPAATEAEAAVLSFASAFSRDAKASLSWISECPPLAAVQEINPGPAETGDSHMIYKAWQECSALFGRIGGVHKKDAYHTARRSVAGMTLEELYTQLSEGRPHWHQHPQHYTAVADALYVAIQQVDASACDPAGKPRQKSARPQLQVYCGDNKSDEDPIADTLAVEQSNYLT